MGESKKLKSTWSKVAYRVWDLGVAPVIFPFKLRRLPLTAVYAFAGLPLLGSMMFPTPEEYLEKHGIDPQVATALCDDTDGYVREQNFVGRLHASVSDGFPHAFFAAYNYWTTGHEAGAYAFHGHFGTQKMFFNQGALLVPDPDNFDAHSFTSMCVGIPENMLERVPLSDEELAWFITFHEIRHLDEDNWLKTPLCESDADEKAIEQHLKVFGNEEIYDFIRNWRAMTSWDADHETALYLDYKKQGWRMPDPEILVAAQFEAKGYIDAYMDRYERAGFGDNFTTRTAACLTALQEHKYEMSIHAVRRLELYVEAAVYFAPSTFGAPSSDVEFNVDQLEVSDVHLMHEATPTLPTKHQPHIVNKGLRL